MNRNITSLRVGLLNNAEVMFGNPMGFFNET